MANRFWVGNGGNWSDNTNHWSATSGGAAGASLPTSADSVFFNASSFTLAAQTVTLDVNANCLDMDWTGSANNPTITFGSRNVDLYGSITFVAAMTVSMALGSVTFQATSTGKTITSNGQSFGTFLTNGSGGGWTLQDALTVTVSMTLLFGSLNTNGKAVTTSSISLSNSASLTLGASVFNCGTFSINSTSTLVMNSAIVNCVAVSMAATATLSAGTSTINCSGGSFLGGGKTYYNVALTSNCSITGSNTINTLTFTAGKIYTITSGTTQTVTSLIATGTITNPITLRSSSSGSAASISKTSGTLLLRNLSLKDITATGGATFYALASTIVSGVSGFTFSMIIGQIKLSGNYSSLYWTDGSGVLQKISG